MSDKIRSNTIASESPYDGLFLKKRGGEGFGKMHSEPHRDDYYMFGVLTSGSVVVAIDFKEITVGAGTAVILRPGQVHYSLSASNDMSGWLLAVAPDHLGSTEIEAVERYSLNPVPVLLSKVSGDHIAALLEILYARIAESVTAQAIACAVRSIILSEINTTDVSVSGRYVEITRRFKKLLEEHIRTDKQPARYASMLNISPSYLNEAVRNVTGMNVTNLIRSKVVILAKRMLRHTSMTGQEIAYSLGYEDYAYFSRLFKKDAGMTPSQFRQNG